jgi:hypothetical protein
VHANRIALAFVLAGLASPALAEKCSVCDFSDEPIVVKPTKSGSAPSVGEIVVTKLSDATSPSFDPDRPVLRGNVPNSGEIPRYNLTNAWPSKGGVETQARGTYSKTLTFTLSTTTPLEPAGKLATAVPQPTPAGHGGGMGQGKVSFSDISLKTAPVLPAGAPAAAPGSRR